MTGCRRPKADGGLGLGTTWTSVLFLATILAVVVYLAVTKRDQAAVPEDEAARDRPMTTVRTSGRRVGPAPRRWWSPLGDGAGRRRGLIGYGEAAGCATGSGAPTSRNRRTAAIPPTTRPAPSGDQQRDGDPAQPPAGRW